MVQASGEEVVVVNLEPCLAPVKLPGDDPAVEMVLVSGNSSGSPSQLINTEDT